MMKLVFMIKEKVINWQRSIKKRVPEGDGEQGKESEVGGEESVSCWYTNSMSIDGDRSGEGDERREHEAPDRGVCGVCRAG
jgi:hypothetical protein